MNKMFFPILLHVMMFHFACCNTRLLTAVMNGAKNRVAKLLAKGTRDLNKVGAGGITPLHAALERGHEEIADMLMKKGANVNAEDPKRRRPLHVAVERKLVKSVRKLLRRGANVEAYDVSTNTALHYAARCKSKVIVDLLLKSNDSPVDDANNKGFTPLHEAILYGNKKVAAALLNADADIDAVDFGWNTPLHLAVREMKKDLVEFLIAKGASLNVQTSRRETPLHLSVKLGKEGIMNVLLNAGAYVDAVDSYGYTALHYATMVKRQSILNTLLRKSNKLNAKSTVTNYVPLDLAILFGEENHVRILLEAGALVDKKDGMEGPLHFAIKMWKKKEMDMLLRAGANMEIKNHMGETSLKYAIRAQFENPSEHNTMAFAIIEAGADLTLLKPQLLLKSCWDFSDEYDALYDPKTYGNFDDYAAKMLHKYLTEKLHSEIKTMKHLVKVYENIHIFALYRILKLSYSAVHGGKLGTSQLENAKLDVFDVLIEKFVSKMYLERLPSEIVSEVLYHAAGYYAWKMERLALNLVVAMRTLNTNMEKTRTLAGNLVRKNLSQL